MSECLGCQRLEDESVMLIELASGQKVCSYCPEWLIESEAMGLLAKPLKERQRLLRRFEEERGKPIVDKLKARMKEVFERNRKLLQKDQPAL